MRKIIPFLFGVIMLTVLVLIRMHVVQIGQAKGGAVADVDEVEDAVLVNDAAFTSGATNVGVVLPEPPLAAVRLATMASITMAERNTSVRSVATVTASQLIPVQPGFGGGGARPLLQNLPEYKEEPSKVDPVIEFEYCN